ncbi:hypothetical protein BUALT_BualtUnG0053300 [Buddleja alternifolia]|uniref:Uncharacterized protein n=1 Tax=Buddleja alternifolia TaxID=168488 RepID=A0AAV6W072_9LAMI|nr:hypothetical protein BUALT_BualtUnG0053300 [Buddleja alternifolia]
MDEENRDVRAVPEDRGSGGSGRSERGGVEGGAGGGGAEAGGAESISEFQAECVLRRVQVRGFHVVKRQAEMLLCWHDRPLVATSAWS